MKRLLVCLTLVLGACPLFAQEAKLVTEGRNPPSECFSAYTPVSITLVTPVALPPGTWDVKGFEIGLVNWHANFDGWQIGVFNGADWCRGWQLGAVNVTRKMYGVQIGVVNLIQDNDVPFLPILNCYF